MKVRCFAFVIAVALVGAACSSSGDDPVSTPNPGTGTETTSPQVSNDGSDAATADAEEFVEGLADELEEQQAESGGGSGTLTVGDQTWTFAPLLCAFGEAEIGQAGAEFVLSGLQDGMQMYASIDTFGHLVSLDDIEDFENPKVSLQSVGDGVIMIDGKSISAEMDFIDNTSDSASSTPGTFTATCP
ncbi:MAG: hypothetical protein M3132_02795 [Actinomycetia bacterium]|nr:hypothetical protein [Actinomycetes bacterium]